MRPYFPAAAALLVLMALVGIGFAGRQSATAVEPAPKTSLPDHGVATTVSSHAVTPVSWLTDYDQALALSKSSGKPLFMDFTGSDWCPGCKLLKTEVFESPEFAAWAARSVILLELDFPRNKPQPAKEVEQNLKLNEKYLVEGFPTVIIVGIDGKELVRATYQPNVSAQRWIEVVAKAAGLQP